MPGSSRRRSTSEGEGGILSSTLNLPDYAQTSRLPEFNPVRCGSTPHINTTGFIDDTYRDHRRVALQLTETRSIPASFSLNGDRSTHEVNPCANIPSSARSFNQDIVFQDEPGIVNTPA